jgi:uncharacterized protein (DUF1697 family)
MPSHVALLRGINVGGRNRVSMDALEGIVSALGHSEVSTYIQSGNVLFTSAAEEDSAALSSALEQAIARELEFAPQVVVLSRAELAEAIAANPYAAEPNPKYVHAVFHRRALGPERVAEAAAAEERAAAQGSADRAHVAGRTLYLHTPEGIGRSDLATRLTRPTGARRTDAGTARNLATVTKLFELLGA